MIQGTLKTLRNAQLPRTHAFITGCVMETRKSTPWAKAGQAIGNHTFSHLALSKVTAPEYIADLDRLDPVLAARLKKGDLRYFRYPYLDMGDTEEKYSAVAAHLKEKKYVVAPASIPIGDHRWAVAYERCLNAGNKAGAKAVRQQFVEAALRGLKAAEAHSQKLYSRVIPLILLLHLNSLENDSLAELLQAYKNSGVRFTTLEAALEDAAYAEHPGFARYDSGFFLNQVAQKKGISLAGLGAGIVDPPAEKFASFCP